MKKMTLQNTNLISWSAFINPAIYSALYSPETVAAWFETNRALCAQTIIVYYQENIHRSHCAKICSVRMVQQCHHNINNCFGQMLLTLNCQYRNIFTTKYLIFHDLDEMIIPQKDPIDLEWDFRQSHKANSPLSLTFCFVYLHDDQGVMPMDDIRGCSALTDILVIFKRTKRSASVDCRTSKWKNIRDKGVWCPGNCVIGVSI